MDNTDKVDVHSVPKWLEDMTNSYISIPKRIPFWIGVIVVTIIILTVGFAIIINIETASIRHTTNSTSTP